MGIRVYIGNAEYKYSVTIKPDNYSKLGPQFLKVRLHLM